MTSLNPLVQKLATQFMKFPGIGPRQAARFVYYLLNADDPTIAELTAGITELRSRVALCGRCCRFFPNGQSPTPNHCTICRDQNRDNILMIVEKDVDLENVERTADYHGYYFVLGGLLPAAGGDWPRPDRLQRLAKQLRHQSPAEIVLALATNPAGDHSAFELKKLINGWLPAAVKTTVLGKGLSTGAELEYSDYDTLRHALKNRSVF